MKIIIKLPNEIEDERQETKRKESFMKKELRPWQIEAVKKLEEQDDRNGTPRSVVSQASEDSVEKIINQIDNLLASYN